VRVDVRQLLWYGAASSRRAVGSHDTWGENEMLNLRSSLLLGMTICLVSLLIGFHYGFVSGKAVWAKAVAPAAYMPELGNRDSTNRAIEMEIASLDKYLGSGCSAETLRHMGAEEAMGQHACDGKQERRDRLQAFLDFRSTDPWGEGFSIR
jgi:hypothetical protein